MKLTAVFESWHLPDGNYPPLHRDQLVNLSFEVEPSVLSKTSTRPERFDQIVDANYKFTGTVLRVYDDSSNSPIVVIQAGAFKFYMNSFPKEAPLLVEGDKCEGQGKLLLDHYIWVEFRSTYQDPP